MYANVNKRAGNGEEREGRKEGRKEGPVPDERREALRAVFLEKGPSLQQLLC
jgi:hypothetical protein